MPKRKTENAPVKEQEIEKKESAKNKKTDTGSELATTGALGILGDIVEPEQSEDSGPKEIDYSDIEGFPYIGFMSDKGDRSKDVAMDLGNVAKGTPWVFVDDEYFNLTGASIMLVKKFRFWGISSRIEAESYRLKEVRFEEPESREESDAPDNKQQTGWMESFVIFAVVFSKDFAIPMPFVSTLKTVKARWAKKLSRAQDKSQVQGWEKKSDLHAKLVTLPVHLRVCGTLKMSERTGSSAKYHVADMNIMTTSHEMVEKIKAAGERKDFEKLIKRGMALFSERVDDIKKYVPNKKGIVPATNMAAWSPEVED